MNSPEKCPTCHSMTRDIRNRIYGCTGLCLDAWHSECGASPEADLEAEHFRRQLAALLNKHCNPGTVNAHMDEIMPLIEEYIDREVCVRWAEGSPEGEKNVQTASRGNNNLSSVTGLASDADSGKTTVATPPGVTAAEFYPIWAASEMQRTGKRVPWPDPDSEYRFAEAYAAHQTAALYGFADDAVELAAKLRMENAALRAERDQLKDTLLQLAETEDRRQKAEERVAKLEQALRVCQLCSHEWKRHDPEDGKCDAGPPCECGRDLLWMQGKIAVLSKKYLSGNANAERQDNQ